MIKNRAAFINKDALALIIVLFISVALLLNRNSPQIHHLKLQFTALIRNIAYPITWYNTIFTIREENKLLKEKLIQFKLMNAELESYHYQNKRLKEMLNFISNQPLNFITANVVGHNFGLPVQSITIDVGSEEGIMNNLTIIDENGLLGKTVTIADHVSLVQLITDKNFRVSIRIGEEKSLGLFVPTHGKYGVLEGVRKSLPLTEGEIAFTSGISEIYPPNIPVAKVISIQLDDNNPFQQIVVELLGSLETLDYIFIIL